MNIRCLCGYHMNNAAVPNGIEHILINDYAQELLETAVDNEVRRDGKVDFWPDHWEDVGAIVVWKCPQCNRLYLNADAPDSANIQVYVLEQTGLPTTDTQ